MGLRGRPPQTAETLKLKGVYREDRHGDRANMPVAAGLPEKPAGMDADAEWMWGVIERSVAAGTLTLADTPIMRQACEVWSLVRKTYVIASNDPTDRNAKAAHLGYSQLFNQLAVKLGLSPADRSRIRLTVDKKPTKQEGKSRFFRA